MSESNWPHAPPHRLFTPGTYMVTSGTYQKLHYFNSDARLNLLLNSLLKLANEFHWYLNAWAIFPNHYHFIGNSQTPENLKEMLRRLHGGSSFTINREDQTPGRKIWQQYWDSKITFQESYYARLNYVHNNPVKHKIVKDAKQYKWCSASWFEETAPESYVKTIQNFKIDQVNVMDDF